MVSVPVCLIYLVFLQLSLISSFKVNGKAVSTVDSDIYSDDIYHKLVEEYNYDLIRTTRKATTEKFVDYYENESNTNANGEYIEQLDEDITAESDNEKKETLPEESYKDAIQRLQCNNPWFWNSFKCLWLDIRKRNYSERTRSNSITVAWILGPPIVILLAGICGFCVVACFLGSRVKKIGKKIEEMRNLYEPGKITLDNGSVKEYPPSVEETEAFYDLMSTLVSIV